MTLMMQVFAVKVTPESALATNQLKVSLKFTTKYAETEW